MRPFFTRIAPCLLRRLPGPIAELESARSRHIFINFFGLGTPLGYHRAGRYFFLSWHSPSKSADRYYFFHGTPTRRSPFLDKRKASLFPDSPFAVRFWLHRHSDLNSVLDRLCLKVSLAHTLGKTEKRVVGLSHFRYLKQTVNLAVLLVLCPLHDSK